MLALCTILYRYFGANYMITEMQCKFLDAVFAHDNKLKQNLFLGEGKDGSFYWVTKNMRLEYTRDK